jgi:LL-diaminopimelate aminotransferase
MLPAAFINPGDVTLMTVPGYPVAGTHTHYYGGTVFKLPLLAENDFFPDLESIPADVRQRAKLLVLNYPNSPTGKVATKDFYKCVIDFAHKNNLAVIQDAAHIMLSYHAAPLSFLQVPGAKDVGVEVHSMSKGFHMIGWRLGWVCGHERIVRAFSDVKDNSDSGQFIAIQKAAAEALDDESIPKLVKQKYERRLRKLVETLSQSGFTCKMPGGTYFLYARSPRGLATGEEFETAEAASQYLITQHSIVTVPWDDAGPFLRFSVTYEAENEQAEDALMAETLARMKKIQPQF